MPLEGTLWTERTGRNSENCRTGKGNYWTRPGSVHSVTRSSKKMPVLHSSTRAAAKTKSWTQGDGRPSPQPKPARPKEGLPSHTHTWSDTGFESELNPKFPFGFKAELYQD
ncbi:hypothetical protein E5288_WYG006250 [Bos mutus]|uniref:Uncharacterized protein n=1 Tax=Bos mutus TaxID=72004 RepID=A0A6B0QVQ7_9CETA|nr:hypothetical protein [Bos mutus]